MNLKMKHFINAHKAITGVLVLVLIAIYGRWQSYTAMTYLALHGMYGLLWLLKSRIFPDKTWECPTSRTYGVVVIWGALTLYWVAPLLITANDVQAPAGWLAVCVMMYTLGVFLHFASDMQKYMQLRLRPNQLIDDGMLARCRNLNYFGELLIYLGFGLLAMHWLPVVILGLFVLCYWLPNMLRKDKSLARFAGFAAYKKRSVLFIPFIV
jgi:steroid 5-alpha reductase family enzyme